MHTLENLKSLIAEVIVCDPADIKLLDTFAALGLDSLDHIQLVAECEDAFEISIPDEDAAGLLTVAGLYDAILRAQSLALD